MSHRARRWAGALGIALGVVLAGCVTPATGIDSYRHKAAMSVTAASSEVETARLTVRTVLADRMLKTYADETISGSEQALGAISSAFASVQPPQDGDQLREDVNSLLTNAEDAVAGARIAVRRSDRNGLEQALNQLNVAATDLDAAEKQLP
jgi:hypothetical protein